MSNQTLQGILEVLNQRGSFTASVLTDSDGLPLAAITKGANELAEVLAAVAPLVERMAQRSNERAGLSAADEVVISNANRSRLVCRFFEANQQRLILACLVPNPVSFRRVMNQMIDLMQKLGAD